MRTKQKNRERGIFCNFISLVALMNLVFGTGRTSRADPGSDGNSLTTITMGELGQHKNAKNVDNDSQELKDEGRTYVACWLDVSAAGKRYYGLYQEIRDNGRVVEASGVVLMPWDERPNVSLGPYGEVIADTVVKIGDKEKRFPGRPLLLITGDELKIVAKDIPFSNFGGSRARMERAVKDLLSKHATLDPGHDKGGSPRSMMEAYLGAIFRGNPEGVGSAFDLTTDEGRAGSQASRKQAEIMRSIREVKGRIKEKFGPEGAKVTENTIGWNVLADENAIQDYLRKQVKIYIGEDGDTAVVHVPGWKEYVRLKRKGDRWFIDVNKDEAFVLSVFSYAVGHDGFITRKVDEVRKIVLRAKTIQELKTALENFKEEEKARQEKEKLNPGGADHPGKPGNGHKST